jgi:hypothetical protein
MINILLGPFARWVLASSTFSNGFLGTRTKPPPVVTDGGGTCGWKTAGETPPGGSPKTMLDNESRRSENVQAGLQAGVNQPFNPNLQTKRYERQPAVNAAIARGHSVTSFANCLHME